MIEFDNRTSMAVDEGFFETIASEFTQKEIELIITDNAEMREINREHRGIDKDTDVLSFPFEDLPFAPLGSIVISADHVHAKSVEYGHSERDECALLFIHGLLHLLGFDHEIDNGEMRQEEERLIKKYALPASLIVRTEEA